MGQSVLTVWSILTLSTMLDNLFYLIYIIIIYTWLSGFALLCIVWISGDQKWPCCLYHFFVINTVEFPSQRPVVFSLICAWINGWANDREAGDLRRHRAHYDVIVMNEKVGIMITLRFQLMLATAYSAANDDKVVIKTTPYAFMNTTALRKIVLKIRICFHNPLNSVIVLRSLNSKNVGQWFD